MEKTKAISSSQPNSIIELARFFFAVIVVIHHSFYFNLPIGCERGYLAVDFFFILSGYLFIKQVAKFRDKPFSKSLAGFTWARIKSLGFVFAVALVFSVLYYVNWLNAENVTQFFAYKGETGPFGFLWYIQNLIPILVVMFVLHRLIKNNAFFLLLLAFLTVMCSNGFLPDVLWAWGWGYGGLLRGFAEVSLGILIYHIPKIKNKYVSLVALIIIIPLIIWQLFLPEKAEILYNLAFILSCSFLVYFAFQIDVRSKFVRNVFYYLGSLSFSIYCFQAIPLVLDQYGFVNWKLNMAVLISFVLVANTANFNKFILNKQQKEPTNEQTQNRAAETESAAKVD